MTLNKEECKHIMWPILKFGLNKDGISSTLHTVVRYGSRYIGGIVLFDPSVIQAVGRIDFLIKHYYKLTPYRPLLWAGLSILKLELGRGRYIFKKNYTETQQWLQTEYWIREVWKFVSVNHINTSHIDKELSTQCTHDACLMSHLSLKGDFTTSELPAIN